MQPCQALIKSPDVLNKILSGKPGAVQSPTRPLVSDVACSLHATVLQPQ